jgi:hypothetical protein
LAEAQMDRRLHIARQRKAEVGFVKEVLAAANCMSTLTHKTVLMK